MSAIAARQIGRLPDLLRAVGVPESSSHAVILFMTPDQLRGSVYLYAERAQLIDQQSFVGVLREIEHKGKRSHTFADVLER
jgi:hypothetical protein